MKILLAFLLSFSASAFTFLGEIHDMRCDMKNKFYGESCIVRILNHRIEFKEAAPDFVAIVFHGDFWFDQGRFVYPGKPVAIDLSYVEEITNSKELKYLERRFGQKYRYFFHDAFNSKGGFEDVLSIQRRD